MAYSSSFINKREVCLDQACYASIKNSVKEEGTTYVIIEEDKFIFPLDVISSFLDDCKEMGFDFTYKYQERKKRVLIDVSDINGASKRMAFFTIVRFLWEGAYGSEYDKLTDDFTQVVHHYFKVKELLPNEGNKLTMLCIASNCYLKGGAAFNENHFLTTKNACKLLKKLGPMDSDRGVHPEFNDAYGLNLTESLQKAEKWTLANYTSLFKEIKYKK